MITAMTNTVITAFRNTTHLCVKIRASHSGAVKPINLALLVDTSGSMEGERLNSVKKTLHAARELFRSEDQLTMVTFDDRATVVADHIHMDVAGIQQFYTAVDAVRTSGSTNLSIGIEQLLVLQDMTPFDAVMLLTDGHVNRGIMTTVGLRSMMLGLGTYPITALGYGAEHNRILLRELATGSRGAYVFVDSEDILPLAMGDMIGGLRTELHKNTFLHVPLGWKCCETTTGNSSYRLGSLVPDRDYWVVFEKEREDEISEVDHTITLASLGGGVIAETDHAMFSDCQELQEQVLRCRVVKAIVAASENMERGLEIGPDVAALAVEFQALPEFMLQRPLVLRMQAQLAEILAAPPPFSHGCPPPSALLARMSSGGAYLSTQRGVSTQAPGDPEAHTFSSPTQHTTSTQVYTRFAT